MEIYGKKYTVKELRKRIGNPDQIAGIRQVQLDDGNERPMRAAQFHTGSGLEFTVLIDRCLDISAASFCGKAMGWRSTTGDLGPQYFEPEGLRWLRGFYGGLMITCGLTQAGGPAPDSALSGNGLHGRIGNIPARDLKVEQGWQGNDYILSVTGTMRETAVFGENLTLTRRVWTKLGERRIWVDDVLTNEGFKTTKTMLLYHCNIGWPAVDEGSELLIPSRHVAPRDVEAAEGKQHWNKIDAPTHNYSEKVYYHDVVGDRNGWAKAAIVNKGFSRGQGEGFGVYVKYNTKQLPRFTEWKQMGEQDYVVGLEPCTCGVEGRAADEERGLMHRLRPGQSRGVQLEFGPITDKREVQALRAACAERKPKLVKSYTEFVRKP